MIAIEEEKGGIYFENRRKIKKNELDSLRWIISNFGGIIVSIRPFALVSPGIKAPDAIWDGKWLEIKNTGGKLSTIDGALRYAIKQCRKEIIYLDVTKSKEKNKNIIKIVSNRIKRSGGELVLIVRNNNLVGIISKKGVVMP